MVDIEIFLPAPKGKRVFKAFYGVTYTPKTKEQIDRLLSRWPWPGATVTITATAMLEE